MLSRCLGRSHLEVSVWDWVVGQWVDPGRTIMNLADGDRWTTPSRSGKSARICTRSALYSDPTLDEHGY